MTFLIHSCLSSSSTEGADVSAMPNGLYCSPHAESEALPPVVQLKYADINIFSSKTPPVAEPKVKFSNTTI